MPEFPEPPARPASVPYLDPVMKRSRVLALVLVTVVSAVLSMGSVSPSPAAASSAAGGFRCTMEAFGHTQDGRITFRRVVNDRVEVSKTTAGPVGWRPISWTLVSYNGWPGHEETEQLVAATDGKIRLVATEWNEGGSLSVRVLKVVGRGYPSRLITFDNGNVFWVGADRALRRARFTGSKLVRRTVLPVTISGATAMTARGEEFGESRIYYTDRAGALHVVTNDGAKATDVVLKASGYRGVTGLRAGGCSSANGARHRPYLGLLLVKRTTGEGRFQRILRPTAANGGRVTKSVRVGRSDWTWRRLG